MADEAKVPSRRSIARYGWVRDLPDSRDHIYSSPHATLTKAPPKVDLTSKMPPVYDQGQLGSCTANALGGAFEYDTDKQGLADYVPSRLFIYYNERAIEGSVSTDSGAQIRDGVKTLATQGVCPETEWPYDITKFTRKPPAKCYKSGLTNLLASYQKVPQVIAQLKGCLADGYPIVFGFTVYESFESAAVAKSGIVSLPTAGEKVLGGHAVVAVGYDDSAQRFRVRNSWGTGWGQKGYFTMPYAYLCDTSLSSDFWTLRIVT